MDANTTCSHFRKKSRPSKKRSNNNKQQRSNAVQFPEQRLQSYAFQFTISSPNYNGINPKKFSCDRRGSTRLQCKILYVHKMPKLLANRRLRKNDKNAILIKSNKKIAQKTKICHRLAHKKNSSRCAKIFTQLSRSRIFTKHNNLRVAPRNILFTHKKKQKRDKAIMKK